MPGERLQLQEAVGLAQWIQKCLEGGGILRSKGFWALRELTDLKIIAL